MCQGPLWENMGVSRRNVFVCIARMTSSREERRRSCMRMYRNSAQNRNERKQEQGRTEWAQTWANERKRTMGAKRLYIHPKVRHKIRRNDEREPKEFLERWHERSRKARTNESVMAPNIRRIESAETIETTVATQKNVGRNKSQSLWPNWTYNVHTAGLASLTLPD